MNHYNNYKRTIFSWSIYDFANQPFTTIILTFVYSTFFVDFIAPSGEEGAILWGRAITVSSLFIAVFSPIMGAIADNGGYRKFFLIFWTWVCVVFSYLLYYPTQGEIFYALLFFCIANIGFEMGGVFCNAFLPDIASKENIGRVSGYGWSMGYVGGLIALIIGYFCFVNPEIPIFNLDKITHEHIRGTNIMVAVWFAIFSIPTFLFVHQKRHQETSKENLIRDSLNQVKDTFRNIRQYKEMTMFLLARLFYNDGLITVFAFGGIYAAGTFGFSFKEVFMVIYFLFTKYKIFFNYSQRDLDLT